MNLTKRSVKFEVGDRVRIAHNPGSKFLHVGLTGKIVEADVKVLRTRGDKTKAFLVRFDKPLAVTSIVPNYQPYVMYANELEYEDNRDDEIWGGILAWNLDYVRTGEDGPRSCESDSHVFKLFANAYKGWNDRVWAICPDCGYSGSDAIAISPQHIVNYMYNCVRPYREIDAEFYEND